jgi:hypothetical protein
MPRFFFDIRDDDDTLVDEEGIDLPDLKAAQMEAAKSLTAMAADVQPEGSKVLAIDVRTAEGRVLTAAITFENAGD